MAVFALIIHLVFGGGLIYAAEIDNLNTTISSNFSKAYSNYGDSLITTIGIDIVQVCLKNISPLSSLSGTSLFIVLGTVPKLQA